MVAQVLGSIQDKVEAQHSAGVDAARARLLEAPRSQRNVSDEDRAAARTLLNKPRSKRKKKKDKRLPIWVQALLLLFVLGGVIGALAFALQPPSPEKLYKEAERLMASSKPENHDRAREGPIKDYLRRYGNRAGAQTEQIRKWADDYDVARYEQLLTRYINHEKRKKGLAVESQNEGEKAAFKAALAEYDGETDKARQGWKQAEEVGSDAIGALARRHLQMLDAVGAQERALQDLRVKAIDSGKEPTDLGEMQRQAFLALRQERLGGWEGVDPKKTGDREGARRRYEHLRLAAEKDEANRLWFLFASIKTRQMNDYLNANPEAREIKERVALVRKIIADARTASGQPGIKLLKLRSVARDIEVLYDQEAEMAEPIKEAKALGEEIDRLLGRAPGKS
jgi:hypothetical protein